MSQQLLKVIIAKIIGGGGRRSPSPCPPPLVSATEDVYVSTGSTAMRAQPRKPGAPGVLSLQVKYDPASRMKCNAKLIIDDIQYSRKSCVMINTNLEQFLSPFLVGNYILSPKTITRKVSIFQDQTRQTDPSTTPP